MSKNEWESGTFHFTAKAYRSFKKKFLADYLALQKKDLAALKEAVNAIKAKAKGVRNPNWEKLLDDMLYPVVEKWGALYPMPPLLQVTGKWEALRQVLRDRVETPLQSKFAAPVRMMVEYVPRKSPKLPTAAGAGLVNSQTKEIAADYCTVSFDDLKKTVCWEVAENNHACEEARKTGLGLLFFSSLKSVDWGRSEGGEIVGNDEYNREGRAAGGGSNYVKQRFGPRGAKT